MITTEETKDPKATPRKKIEPLKAPEPKKEEEAKPPKKETSPDTAAAEKKKKKAEFVFSVHPVWGNWDEERTLPGIFNLSFP